MEQSHDERLQKLQDMAHKLRIHAIDMTDTAKSGHATSCSSIAEVISVLYFDESGLHYHPTDPKNAANDKCILSKGHACPIWYAAWAEAGNFPVEDLKNLRKVDSDLEGHPTPRLSFCDVATGSLGQGLGFTCGAAYSSKYFDKVNNKYFCLMGDGECAEGSVWEAASFASHYKLDNLITIIDVNRLGQSDPTSLDHHTEIYEKRFSAFGFHTISIDGHNIKEIVNAFTEARTIKDQPVAIISKTFKGKYFGDDVENKLNWHGKPITAKSENVKKTLRSWMKDQNVKLTPTKPDFEYNFTEDVTKSKYNLTSTWDKTKKVSTREAYGQALKKLGENDLNNHIIGLDGDVKNSTYAEYYEKAHPDKFINCFIAEQNMISVALGLSKRNKIPFVSTFAAFYSRAFDQIRMSAISFGNIKFFGSHSGVNIGEDGPSQMALEDLAMFRAVPDCLVLYPSDAVSMEKAVEIAANYSGIVFLKGGRNNHSILYENSEVFEIGKGKVLKSSEKDVLTVITAGPPLFEIITAYERLAKENIHIRIIDIFSVKPLDHNLLIKAAGETGKVFVVEDHYPEGGIGGIYFIFYYF